jgi:hypothetical protein
MYNVARHSGNALIQCNIKFSYLCLQLTSAENELAELNKALEDQEQQFEDEISNIREEAELQRVRSHLSFLVNIDFRMSLDRPYDHKSFQIRCSDSYWQYTQSERYIQQIHCSDWLI